MTLVYGDGQLEKPQDLAETWALFHAGCLPGHIRGDEKENKYSLLRRQRDRSAYEGAAQQAESSVARPLV